MTFPPRFVVVLSFVQAFFIVARSFITRSSLKIFDKVMPEMLGSHAPSIPAVLQFVRSFGFWCLLAPIVWSVVAACRAEVTGGIASLTPAQFVVGILLTLTLVALFSVSVVMAVELTFRPF